MIGENSWKQLQHIVVIMPTHLCNKKEKEIIDDDDEDKGMNSENRRMMTKKAEL